MRIFANRGFIAERAVRDALKAHFDDMRLSEYYKNAEIRVTNRHPFASLAMGADASKASLFPAVVVAEQSESKPPELQGYQEADFLAFNESDIKSDEKGEYIAYFRDNGYEVFPKGDAADAAIIEKIRADGACYGVAHYMARRAVVTIEIWSENLEQKNELYEIVRLFCGCSLHDALRRVFGDLDANLFDVNVRGERSNNVNVNFGKELWGGFVEVQIDCVLAQLVADTEAKDARVVAALVSNWADGKRTKSAVFFGECEDAE